MKEDTSTLIHRLAEGAAPVRPLPRPWLRAAVWLILSGIAMMALGTLAPIEGLPSRLGNPAFILEQIGALGVGVGAAIAAFASVVPGSSRKAFAWLLLPLAIWLGSLCTTCIDELSRLGFGVLSVPHNVSCFPYITGLAIFPGIAMATMLRRGAPMTPRLSIALGAFASAGLANFYLRIVYPEDVTVMLVFWHVGGVFFLTILAGLAARFVLNWNTAREPTRGR